MRMNPDTDKKLGLVMLNVTVLTDPHTYIDTNTAGCDEAT